MEKYTGQDARTFIKEQGGVTRFSEKLTLRPSTVHYWWRVNKIPEWRWPRINEALAEAEAAP